MKRGLLFLLLLLMFQLSASSPAELGGVSVNNVKVPFYQKGDLQAMIFADTAEYRDQLLYGQNVIINLLQKKVNPDQIHNDWRLQLYPLDAPLKEIVRFWSRRLNYCDAVIYSPQSALNQSERSAASDRALKLRSPLLDLDGKGFASDFKRRQIKVNSDVNIVMRGKNCDPRFIGTNLPARYEFMRGQADMLHMDTDKHQVMLLGKVMITDGNIRLFCDRLTVLLGGEQKLKEKSSMGFSGVRRLHADGNVKVEKILPPGAPPSAAQVLTGDHLVYDVASEQLTVTGDKSSPTIKTGRGFTLRGKELIYFQKKQQLIIPSNCWMRIEEKGEVRFLISDYGNLNFDTGVCDFLGNVRASAPQNELACSKMRVLLVRTAPPAKPVSSAAPKKNSPLGGINTPSAGSLEFKQAFCKGNVKLFRREKQGFSTLDAHEAEINYLTGKVLFTGKVRCLTGGNKLETPRLIVNLKNSDKSPQSKEISHAEALEGVRITGKPDGKDGISVITAQKGKFDYAADRIDFSGNVSAGRGESLLTCEKLQLFLAPRKAGEKAAAIPGVATGAAGSGRTLKSVLASGNAVMKDGKNILSGDTLEYFFVPASAREAAQPGIFQSGSLRLTKVTGQGNVKLSSSKNPEPQVTEKTRPQQNRNDAGVMLGRNTTFRQLTADRMISDFRSHTTVFQGKVRITDGASTMNSEKLELFAKSETPRRPAAAVAPADPDADPFDLPAENSVPSTIALGNGLILDRATASGNVVIDRRPNPLEEGQKVYCDKAVFNSADMTIECTSTDGRRPRAVGSGKTHTSDKFTIFLKDEHLESSGATLTQ